MAALSVLGAQFRLKAEDRSRLLTDLVPWAIQAGSRCADLMCLRYENHFQVTYFLNFKCGFPAVVARQ